MAHPCVLVDRWRSYGCAELMARDSVKLDIFRLRDESLEETENLLDMQPVY
ncbi:MAG TPA: hypothetical protein VLE70_04630 [Anaerolineae bacterium]|nr:hypothetical protein [Anaerolineae bacterium]